MCFVLFVQKDSSGQPEHQYDEFGFRVDAEGNAHFLHPRSILFPTSDQFLHLRHMDSYVGRVPTSCT